MKCATLTILTLLVAVAAAATATAQNEQGGPTTRPAATQPTTQSTQPGVPPVDEIVNRTNYVSYYQGHNGRAQVKMEIVSANGQTRRREMTILRRDQQNPDREERADDEQEKEDMFTGEQKYYVYFHRPADVNGMTFLVWKHLDRDDDRWLYLPGVDLVKRISAADKRSSFAGSHFVYEDVSGRNVDLDEHELVEVTDNYFVLRNTPKDDTYVDFEYFKMWIHRETYVTVQVSYYNERDEEYRRYRAEQVEVIDGYPTVTKSRMSDLANDEHTLMEYTSVEYNIELPEDVFSERYLRRPPYRYLR
ncbi:MAG: outer membrane lipoprotein-sorting protein [Phycisphaerae bacterium]